jgi:hypothetical protein
MSTKQPIALWLADKLEDIPADGNWLTVNNAAAELRRLHSVNSELLEALKDAATSLDTIGRLAGKATYKTDSGDSFDTYMGHHDEVRAYAKSRATVALATVTRITKATGETK